MFRASALCVLLWTSPAYAGGPGTTSAEFLKIAVGARPVSLGEAFVGLADDVNTLGYNPAGLALLRRNELSVSHNQYFEGIRQEWLAIAFPSKQLGTLAFSANLLLIDGFKGYDEFDRPIGDTSASDQAYQVAYARRFGEKVSLGVGAKYLKSRLDQYYASGYAFDVGALVDVVPGLRLGAAFLNGGPGLTFLSEPFPLPIMGKLGASFRPWEGSKRHDLALVADATLPRNTDPYFGGGIEYVSLNTLALRVGGRSGTSAGPGITAGVGLYINRRGRPDRPELDIDYGFVNYGELSHVHRVSVGLRFGAPIQAEEPIETWEKRHWKRFDAEERSSTENRDAPTKPRRRRAQPEKPARDEWPNRESQDYWRN